MGMTSLNWIIWGLLALAALLFILGLLQMIRRHPDYDDKKGGARVLGFLTLLSGVGLGLVSWLFWQPKLAAIGDLQSRFTGLQSQTNMLTTENTRLTGLLKQTGDKAGEVKRLSGIISGLKGDLSANKTSNVELKSENKRLEGELVKGEGDRQEIVRLDGIVKRLNENKNSLEAENKRLKGAASTNNADSAEIDRLSGVIDRLNKDNSSLKAENARLKEQTNTSQADSGETIRLTGLINRLTKDNEGAEEENKRLSGLLTAYRNDSEVKDAKIASLDAELTSARKKPPVTRTIAAKQTPLGLINAHNQDDTRPALRGGNYQIVKMANQSLLRGQKGKYYRIFLKQPNGNNYRFALGSYTKILPETSFKMSLDNAINDIRAGLDGKRNYQLYTRGGASGGIFRGRLQPGYEYKTIKVLEKGLRGKYDNEADKRSYARPLTNEDLPNLRGAYIQDFVAKNYKIAKPIILDGEVSNSRDESKQAVALILFVEE